MGLTLELSDLVSGVQREFSITPSFFRFILSRTEALDKQTLDQCMRVATDLTAITDREVAMIIYSELPKDPDVYNYRNRLISLPVSKLAVPNIGDMRSVHNPTLDKKLYDSFINKIDCESKNNIKVVYVPIVNFHTHPGTTFKTGTFPSKNDLMNTKHRYRSKIDISDIHLDTTNPELQVICTSHGLHWTGNLPFSSQLFYQYTGNEQALQAFLDNYDTLIKRYWANPKEFARQMQLSGAFKTEYFEPGELVERFNVRIERGQGIRITKKNETRLARKFAYNLRIYRP
jgi:hypothetical protein